MIAAPFTQRGNTIKFTANTSGSVPAPVQCIALTGQGPTQYIITNNGSVTAWIGYGPDSATATANAVIPTGGGANATFCMPITAGAQITITAQPNAFFTGITASSTADIYVTPGEGI